MELWISDPKPWSHDGYDVINLEAYTCSHRPHQLWKYSSLTVFMDCETVLLTFELHYNFMTFGILQQPRQLQSKH